MLAIGKKRKREGSQEGRGNETHPYTGLYPGTRPGVLEGKPMKWLPEGHPLDATTGIVTGLLLTFDAFILSLIIWLIVR